MTAIYFRFCYLWLPLCLSEFSFFVLVIWRVTRDTPGRTQIWWPLCDFADHSALSFSNSEPCPGHILTVTLWCLSVDLVFFSIHLDAMCTKAGCWCRKWLDVVPENWRALSDSSCTHVDTFLSVSVTAHSLFLVPLSSNDGQMDTSLEAHLPRHTECVRLSTHRRRLGRISWITTCSTVILAAMSRYVCAEEKAYRAAWEHTSGCWATRQASTCGDTCSWCHPSCPVRHLSQSTHRTRFSLVTRKMPRPYEMDLLHGWKWGQLLPWNATPSV